MRALSQNSRRKKKHDIKHPHRAHIMAEVPLRRSQFPEKRPGSYARAANAKCRPRYPKGSTEGIPGRFVPGQLVDEACKKRIMAELEKTFGPQVPVERPKSISRMAIAACRPRYPKGSTEGVPGRWIPGEYAAPECVIEKMENMGAPEEDIAVYETRHSGRRSGGRPGTSAGRYEGYGYYNGRKTSAGRYDTYYPRKTSAGRYDTYYPRKTSAGRYSTYY
jgi:hypothetical protein